MDYVSLLLPFKNPACVFFPEFGLVGQRKVDGELIAGLYALFLKGQGHQGVFSW